MTLNYKRWHAPSKKLYTLKPVTGTPSMGWNFPSLFDQDKLWLNRLVSSIEIQATLFSMVADKAPGLDGYTTGFFQKKLAYSREARCLPNSENLHYGVGACGTKPVS